MRRPRGLNGMFGGWLTGGREEKWDFPVVEQPVYTHGQVNGVITKKKALVRPDTGEALAIVSDRYKIVKHSQVIDALDANFRQQGAYFKRRAAIAQHGARLLVEYVFPEVSIAIKPGDFVQLTLLAGNSFDTTMSVWARLGAFRLICTNGAIAGKIAANIKRKHMLGLDIDALMINLSGAVDQFRNLSTKWQQYAQQQFTVRDLQHLFDTMSAEKTLNLTEKEVDAIVAQFLRPGYGGQPEFTLWGLFNACTSVASHLTRGEAPTFRMLRAAHDLTEQGQKLLAA